MNELKEKKVLLTVQLIWDHAALLAPRWLCKATKKIDKLDSDYVSLDPLVGILRVVVDDPGDVAMDCHEMLLVRGWFC